MGQITAKQLSGIKTDAVISCGPNLVFRRRGGHAVFLFRGTIGGKRRDIVLGHHADLTLADAREKAAALKKQIRMTGRIDASPSDLTVGEAVTRYIAHNAERWSPIGATHWRLQLTKHAKCLWGSKAAEMTYRDMVDILLPIWTTTPEAARKTLSRMRLVFGSLIATNQHPGPNPCDWDVLKHLLPTTKVVQQHHPAVHWVDAHGVFHTLSKAARSGSQSARCAMWCALSACRSGEARRMEWSEVDLTGSVWRIPAERTKTGKPHVVPLTEQMVALLRTQKELRPIVDSSYVFPNAKGLPLSDVAVGKAHKIASPNTTLHGWRSTFRDWGSEHRHDTTLLELSLGHSVGSAVERAYARSDLVDLRRPIMDSWNSLLTAGTESA